MLSTSDMPAVDLADLFSDRPDRLDRAAAALLAGFGEYGLVTIAGHDLATDAVDACHNDFVAFCQQPEAAKAPYNLPEIWYQRGWTPPNTEAAVVAQGQKDFKECWFSAPYAGDPEVTSLFPELFPDNVWPPQPATFRDHHTGVGRKLHGVGEVLLRGCERALGLDAGTFDELTRGAAHLTRSLLYLPVSAEDIAAGVLWGEEHTDFNLLTVLAGGRFYDLDGKPAAKPDDRSGLYLRTRPTAEHPRGRMVPGRAPAGHLVAQVGQQLEILTGGVLLATPHVIKTPATPGWARSSIAHFVHVHPMKPLLPLPPFRTPEAVEAYRPPVLAGTYAIKTLVDIALAPRETLDRLGYRHYGRLAEIRADGEW
jgi:isopenicillin N synthase-like dioxygenase